MPHASVPRAMALAVALIAGVPLGTGCAHSFLSQDATRSPRELHVVAKAEPVGRQTLRAEPPPPSRVSIATPADGNAPAAYPRQPLRHAAWQPDNTTVKVPLRKIPDSDKVELQRAKDRVNLKVRQAPLNAVLAVIAQQQDLNIVSAGDATEVISVNLHNVTLTDAFDSLMSISGCTWVNRGGIIYVSKMKTGTGADPAIQGRSIRVIPLNFASATDLEPSIKALLTPAGKVFVQKSDPADRRRTREQLVIEDVPANITRIEQYVAQIDQPPRQVLIEAHVLQVTLTDELRHGVNFSYLQRIAGKELALAAVGFADPAASPAAFFSIQGSHLETLVEVLKTTANAKTLASPKVMVVNGQKAKIQIGERLGYLVTTTTQTSTLQNVNFLDVGVVLEVTPQIAADGQVLMQVKPKVSNGQIQAGLPQEQTTQVETTVMVPDGQGIVIGGLISEFDDDRQQKLPLLGDLWLIGRAFQFRLAKKDRKEIIVALVPRIVPCPAANLPREQVEWERAETRLFHGPLLRENRPWEAGLPDAVRDPRRARIDRFPRAFRNLGESHPLPLDYYFPPASRNLRVRPTQIEVSGETVPSIAPGHISFSRVPADESYYLRPGVNPSSSPQRPSNRGPSLPPSPTPPDSSPTFQRPIQRNAPVPGLIDERNFPTNPSLHHSITPSLQSSIRRLESAVPGGAASPSIAADGPSSSTG